MSTFTCQSFTEDELSQLKGLHCHPHFMAQERKSTKALIFYSKTDLHFQHEFPSEHHRTKRNVFFDMIEDFAEDDDDDDDGSEEEENESTSESVESTTTRFGRFMSPLAFSKISETLGMTVFEIYILRRNVYQRNINWSWRCFVIRSSCCTVATPRFISR